MAKKSEKSPDTVMASARSGPRAVHYLLFLTVGLIAATVWTLIGAAVARSQGQLAQFISEARALQGPFLIGFGTWLVLIARSGGLEDRVRRLLRGRDEVPRYLTLAADRRVRFALVSFISVAGTASLVLLGFSASNPLLIFYWVSCGIVCIAAGLATLHTVDLLVAVRRLEILGTATFKYSPAQTPELRAFIKYFTSFTLILSLGYSFAFVGTLNGHWIGPAQYIQAVQWFWPIIYVPVCSIALIYPHLVAHQLIQNAKESTLGAYHKEIDELLARYQNLKGEEVQRANSLVQLFDRISATPDYVIDLGIALRTILPLIFNLGILVAKPLLGS
jgi:hypothetical protein